MPFARTAVTFRAAIPYSCQVSRIGTGKQKSIFIAVKERI
jgi:hypothetical protein